MTNQSINYLSRKYIFTALVFFLVSGGALLVYSKLSGVSGSSGGNRLFQIVSICIYGTATYRLLTRYTKIIPFLIRTGFPLFCLVLLCLISSFWSLDPLTSFRRALALALTYGFCIFLVAKFDINELIYIVWLVCILIAFFGILAIAIPGWGIDPQNTAYGNAIRGLSGHKNDFGRYMALGLLITFHMSSFSNSSKRYLLLVSILFMSLLVLSQSSTALAVVIALIFITPLIRFYVIGKFRFDGKYIIPSLQRVLFLLIFLPFLSWISIIITIEVVELFGKDLTFTGRTTIWEYGLEIGKEKPWLGAGYRNFWNDVTSSNFFTYYNTYWATTDIIRNGHNGFLDVYLELGYVGFLTFLIFIFSFMKINLLRLRDNIYHPKQHVLVFSLLLFYLLYSITEQITLKQSELLWMIIMIFYMSSLKNIYQSRKFENSSIR